MKTWLGAFAQTTTALGVAMIALVWGGVAFFSVAEHERAKEAGLRQGTNLARIFESDISQVVKGADSALLAMRDSYQGDPRNFDLMRMVSSAKYHNDHIIQFVLVGRDGIMKSSSLGTSGSPIDLRDRDYFRYHAQNAADELFISRPVVGRVSGKSTIQLVRKLKAPDGSFDGVLLAALDILRIEKFYNSIDIGRAGVINLVGFDGIIRARSTRQNDAERLAGRSMARTMAFRLLERETAGSYWTTPEMSAQMDGILRLISYRVVDGLPLIAVVALANEDIFEQASARIALFRQVGFALTSFALAVICFGAVRQKRLSTAVAALENSGRSLEQTNFRFNATLENMPLGVAMFDGDQRLIVCNARYGEMYGLTPGQTAPGTTLRAIIEARIASGKCPEDAENYLAGRLQTAADGQSQFVINKLRDGRIIAASHQPMQGGGWVTTHQDITEQSLAEDRLDETEREMIAQRHAVEQALIVAMTDVKGRIIYANDIFCQISGYSRDELIGSDHRLLNSGAHPPEFFRAMYRQISRGKVWRAEICNRAKDGSLYWVDTTIAPQLDREGKPIRYIAIRVDVTARKMAEGALRLSQAEVERKSSQLELALANISQGLCMFDSEQRIVVCNKQYAGMYGLSREETKPGTTMQEILDRRVAMGIMEPDAAEDYRSSLLASLSKPTSEVLHLKDGRAIAISRQPIPDGGWVTTHQDVTERERVEAEIVYIASHDALTGLANRAVLYETMKKNLARVQRDGRPFALMMLDLDRFKIVNDSLGHPIGDQLLRLVAARIRDCTRETDLVARLGGDEFAIVLAAAPDAESSATSLARRLLQAVAAPYEIEGHEINVGTSIGIALLPEHGPDLDRAVKNADLALYKAKSQGRNAYCLFDPSIAAAAELQHSLETDLRTALAQDEFEMHYHPIVALATMETISVEGLIRWRHPKRGLLPPADFIPLAEDSGLINTIGEWVLRKACSDALNWPAHVKVALNLSPLQFRVGHLADIVSKALTETGMPPQRLELEITESVLLESSSENLEALHRLRDKGITIVLDDFGTGYSSLSYLRTFPFDRIKIDRSFIQELAVSTECAAIVSAVASLGRGLHVDTVAEGIETEDQLVLARASGCTQAQGFLFGTPCPAPELDFRTSRLSKRDGEAA